jgi:hypothetical protein
MDSLFRLQFRKLPLSYQNGWFRTNVMLSQTSRAACTTTISFTPCALDLTTIAISSVAPGSTTGRERGDLAESATAEEGD